MKLKIKKITSNIELTELGETWLKCVNETNKIIENEKKDIIDKINKEFQNNKEE